MRAARPGEAGCAPGVLWGPLWARALSGMLVRSHVSRDGLQGQHCSGQDGAVGRQLQKGQGAEGSVFDMWGNVG